jgi:hypothetical protein
MAIVKTYTKDSPDVLVDVEIPDAPVDQPTDKTLGEKKEEPPVDKSPTEGEKKEQPVGDKSKDEPTDKKSDDEPIGSWFDEKYGIKTKKELYSTLETIDSVAQLNKKLEADLEAEKKKKVELEFESEDQRSAYEFTKSIPKDMQPEAVVTLGELRKIDVDAAAPKDLLRMKYLIEHPDLSRDKALYAFDRYYEKYLTVNLEKYDTDKERDDAKKDVEIDIEIKTAAAKKIIREQKEKYKPRENKTEPEKLNPEIERAVAQNAKSMDDFFSKNDKIAIPIEGTDQAITLALTDDMKKELRSASAWVGNPKMYKADGKLEGFGGPQELTKQLVGFLFLPQLTKQIHAQATMIADKKRIEDLGNTNPDRSGKGDVDTSNLKGMSMDEQNERLIQEKEQRKKQQQKR